MGWVMAIAPCWVCRMPFPFNPLRVPSYQGEPICRDCVEQANALRRERGLQPHDILPDAYEPIPETELGEPDEE